MSTQEISQPKRCLRVGITGGIGSGKSFVCKIFEAMGIPIYNADLRAKWLLENDPSIVEQVKSLFGTAAYLPDGTYQRTFIAQTVFSNPEKLAALNQIIHPAVEKDSQEWHENQAKNAQIPYTLKEAALLVESGAYHFLDFLIVVTAPEILRIQRVAKRNNLPENEVKKRIAAQLPESELLKYADAVLKNDGSKSVLQQIVIIHQIILEKSKKV